jgi:FkbM family methyltransferase
VNLILFGAGAAGRYALKYMREQGEDILCFADNDPVKAGSILEGTAVLSPQLAAKNNPDATWIACAISRPAATEIRAEIAAMGVKTKPLWECIPVCHGLPSDDARSVIASICGDADSILVMNDQCIFRRNPDYDEQISPSPISELYFPEFIKRLDDEVFIDCGAADGDTVKDFIKRWPKFKSIVAFEPDHENYAKLCEVHDPEGKGRITRVGMAVSDLDGEVDFTANGDYSSHLSWVESRDASGGSEKRVRVTTLDKMVGSVVPTYIKADVEGSELELLWGARKLLKEHSPALAICAYHTSDHLWEIPLVIHAINPDYKLYFRRYAEGAFEIVWYAVPQDRVQISTAWSEHSIGDNHVG